MPQLYPKKVKYRKERKGRYDGIARRGTEIAFGSFGLKAMSNKWVTTRQLESARRTILRYLKKGGKLWIRIFPQKPVTKKGDEVPMGGGKGAVSHYVFPVERGKIIFELDGISEKIARDAFKEAADKLPIKTRFVKKENI